MGLLLLIGLARLVFYSRTFWNAFKALKVTKRRRKVPRPDLINTQSNTIQTVPSSDPLTAAQRTRRTRIKELTKLCLVWVTWIHSKRFLDWISWAIPFYDELNLALLIWLIVQGASAADTVFKHISRIVTPYEKSFDSILGTTHDVLQVTMYLITNGPKHLNRKWQSWKARQFNKSLLSTRPNSPAARVSVSKPYPTQLHHPKADNLSLKPLDRSTTTFSGIPSKLSSSAQLFVPERRPTLSRKLSAGYKRAVSNSRPKPFLADPGSYTSRSVSTNRLVYPLRSRADPSRTSSYLGATIEDQVNPLNQVSALRISSQANMLPSNPVIEISKDEEEENNSIIIHENPFASIHHTPPILTKRKQSDPPVKTARKRRIREHEDPDAIALRKAKKALRGSTTKRSDRVTISRAKLHPSSVHRQSTETHQSIQPPGETRASPNSLLTEKACQENEQDHTTWRISSNAALPPPDPNLSPSKVPAPMVQRRLHNSDEPLPPPEVIPSRDGVFQTNSYHFSEDQRMREQAMDSLRSLESSSNLPSIDRSTGRLGSRIPSSNMIMKSAPSFQTDPPKNLKSKIHISGSSSGKPKKIKHHSAIITPEFVHKAVRKSSKPQGLKRRREISVKLGQEKNLTAVLKADQNLELLQNHHSLTSNNLTPSTSESFNFNNSALDHSKKSF